MAHVVKVPYFAGVLQLASDSCCIGRRAERLVVSKVCLAQHWHASRFRPKRNNFVELQINRLG